MKALKTMQFTIMGAALVWVLTIGLVACNNKTANTNNLTRGSLQSDGNTMFSSSSLSGQSLNIQVSNIAVNGVGGYNAYQQPGYGYQQPGYGYQQPYGGYNTGYYGGGTQTLSFQLSINSDVRAMSTNLSVNNGYAAQTAYGYQQPGYGYQQPYAGAYGGGYGYYGGQSMQMASYFEVTPSAICYQVTCDEVLLSIVIRGYNGEVRQIAIRRNLREGRIVNMGEYSQYRPVEQLVREI